MPCSQVFSGGGSFARTALHNPLAKMVGEAGNMSDGAHCERHGERSFFISVFGSTTSVFMSAVRSQTCAGMFFRVSEL